jgi:hypothetical protein
MKSAIGIIAASVVAIAPAVSFAAPGNGKGPPASGSISPAHETGQPDQSCEDLGNQPGNSGSSDNTGSAFSENGQSGTVYAGEQAGVNDKNTASVSQYDQACAVNHSNPG